VPAYLCTWNPNDFAWEDLPKQVAQLRKNGFVIGNWTVGTSRKIKAGDRIFFLRQGQVRPGIVASGHAVSDVYEGEHWSGENKKVNYVDIRFDAIQNPVKDPILERPLLMEGSLAKVHWSTQMSGITIPEEAVAELEGLWRDVLAGKELREAGPTFKSSGVVPKLFRVSNGTRCSLKLNEAPSRPATVLADSAGIPVGYRDSNASEHSLHFVEIYEDDEEAVSGVLGTGERLTITQRSNIAFMNEA
jgi:hypothetical protein